MKLQLLVRKLSRRRIEKKDSGGDYKEECTSGDQKALASASPAPLRRSSFFINIYVTSLVLLWLLCSKEKVIKIIEIILSKAVFYAVAIEQCNT